MIAPDRSTAHATALACAIAGASLWGLSFVVPLFMPGVSPWDVSLGRYLVFGAFSAGIVSLGSNRARKLNGRQWAKAFVFAATGYYGCYTALVYAIDLSGPALPTLIMGLTPVSVAFFSNLRTRDIPFSRIALPVALLGAGLLAVNLARHGQGLDARNLWLGTAASVAALGLLTYYLVANILFLKHNPGVTPLAWANATGCALMVFALAALGVRLLQGNGWPWHATQTVVYGYIVGSLVLGLAVSWLGGVLWNHGIARLPASVAGQCIVFWPLSGIVYGCLYQGKPPGGWETLGMAMVFAGVFWGIRAAKPRPVEIEVQA